MRAIFWAVLTSVVIIGTVEYAYRYTGGLPSVTPGTTYLEFQWKIRQARADRVMYVVGDSRVDWGFASRVFTKQFKQVSGEDIHAVNAGLPSGSAQKITEYILEHHPNTIPGILVINFTPGSFCHFTNSPGDVRMNIKRQDYLDHRMTNAVLQWLFTYGRSAAFLFQHFERYSQFGYERRFGWYSRTVFRDGCVNAEAYHNDGTPVIRDFGFYELLFQNIRHNSRRYKKRRDKTLAVIYEAQKKGWKVILTRFPIGDGMRQLEEADLPAFLQPEKIITELSVPFFDYDSDPRTSELPSGESHLEPEGARELSRIMAHDFVPVLTDK